MSASPDAAPTASPLLPGKARIVSRLDGAATANRTRAAGLPQPPSTPEAPVTRLRAWAPGTYAVRGRIRNVRSWRGRKGLAGHSKVSQFLLQLRIIVYRGQSQLCLSFQRRYHQLRGSLQGESQESWLMVPSPGSVLSF